MSVDDGLPHNSVRALAQDAAGFIWLGTTEGLVRYDARDVERFAQELRSQFVSQLHVDREDQLWIGTQDGLWVLGTDRTSLQEIDLYPMEQVSISALRAGEGTTLWVGTTHGLFKVETQGRGIETWGEGRLPVNDVVTQGEQVWVVGEQEIRRLDREGVVRKRCVSSHLPARIWPLGDGLRFGTAQPKSVNRVGSCDTEDLGWSARSYWQDEDGPLWIGTDAGVFRAPTPDRAAVFAWSPTMSPNERDLGSEVRALLKDRAGALWMGTFRGVYRLDPLQPPFARIDGPATPVSSFLWNDGALWIGTFGKGLHVVSNRSGRARVDPEGCRGLGYVWSLAESSRGELYVATESTVCHRDPGGWLPLDVPPGSYRSLRISSDGTLWIAGETGLFRYQGERVSRVLEGRYEVVEPGHNGSVWVARSFSSDSERQVIKLNPNLEEDHALGIGISDGVWDLKEDDDGVLWIATSSGLWRWVDTRGELLDLEKAGVGRVAYSIQEDGARGLWIGTNRGLAKLDLESLSIVGFGPNTTGIGEFNRRAALRLPSGALVLGGMEGGIVFDPHEIHSNDLAPPTVLTDVTILGGSGSRRFVPRESDELVLRPGDVAVTLEFAGLSFTQPRENRFRYRMDRLDTEWIDTDVPSARYAGLAPGRYVFRAEAANNDGVWSTASVSLPVRVIPPLWRTLWFRVGVVLLISALLLLAHNARILQLRRVERMRLKIAADLHDQLSSELTSISLSSDLVSRRESLSARGRDRLAEMGATARQAVQGLRDIVWSIDPEHDAADSLATRLRSVAAALLVEVDYSFRHEAQDEPSVISMEVRRDLLLVFKEVLTNLVRHANASRVEIALQTYSEEVVLEVRDNGDGFDLDAAKDGIGLRSMRRRARELGGSLEISTGRGSGTTVCCRLPL